MSILEGNLSFFKLIDFKVIPNPFIPDKVENINSYFIFNFRQIFSILHMDGNNIYGEYCFIWKIL